MSDLKLIRFIRENSQQNFPLSILRHIINNIVMGAKSLGGATISTDSGASHRYSELGSSIAYIEEVFADYKNNSGVERFHGVVAEVGPGDNCGVALLFLADGCERVELADRFYASRDARVQGSIYRALLNKHEKLAEIASYSVDSGLRARGLKVDYGPKAAAETFFKTPENYDFIVSRAVMEHVSNPLFSIKQMVSALKSGGQMVHFIDLRDHGMFSGQFHELKFLEVPDFLYPSMVKFSGKPNRVLVNDYRAVLDRLPVTYKLLVRRLAGVGPIIPAAEWGEIPMDLRQKSLEYIAAVRSCFSKRIKKISDEDLCVAGFVLAAKKRGIQVGS